MAVSRASGDNGDLKRPIPGLYCFGWSIRRVIRHAMPINRLLAKLFAAFFCEPIPRFGHVQQLVLLGSVWCLGRQLAAVIGAFLVFEDSAHVPGSLTGNT